MAMFVFEDIHAPRRSLFTLAGIRVEATRLAWIGPLWWLLVGFALTLLLYPSVGLLSRVAWAVVLSIMVQGGLVAHSIGHVITSKLARAPMDVILITPFRYLTLYEGDQSQFPPRVHILRAGGGALGNLIAILFGVAWIVAFGSSPAVLFWIIINIIFGGVIFLPVKSFDGEVIWHYLRNANAG